MGFRFHKAIKLLPGVKLNLSKSGGSVSLGEKGFTYNIGEKGNKATVGLPGTGMSYSSYESRKSGNSKAGHWIVVAIVIIGALYKVAVENHMLPPIEKLF